MGYYGDYVTRLTEELARLPGVGDKTAQKLAFHILNMSREEAESLTNSIKFARENVKYCSICCNLTDEDPCHICKNPKRDHGLIMVVEQPKDMAAYERTGSYRGLYHILHGALSPMENVNPEDLCVKELVGRLNDGVREVILATSSGIEGETTAMYLCRLIKPLNIRVSRIASGVPVGSELEYVDEVTLFKAFECRREM